MKISIFQRVLCVCVWKFSFHRAQRAEKESESFVVGTMFVILAVVCVAFRVVHWTNRGWVRKMLRLRVCHFIPPTSFESLFDAEMRLLVPQQTFILTRPTKHCWTKICGPPKTSVLLLLYSVHTITMHKCVMHANGSAHSESQFPKDIVKSKLDCSWFVSVSAFKRGWNSIRCVCVSLCECA